MGKLFYPLKDNKPELRGFVRLMREREGRIVLTGGTFDVERLTPVHIEFLRACREMGDGLVVNVTNDQRARLRKNGEKSSCVPRPYLTEEARANYVSALDAVDCAVVHPYIGNPHDPEDIGPTERLAKLVRPDILVKGIQSDSGIGWEREEVAMVEDFLGYSPEFRSVRIDDDGISSTETFRYRAGVERGLELQEV